MGIDPATLTIASTIIGGLSTGFQVLGSIQQGKAEKASAEYNASVAAANAEIAKQKTAMAGAAATAQTEQAQLKTRAQIGGIITSQAASGINVGSGSALDVRSSARDLGQLNAITVRSNAARTAYGYQTEAMSYDAQSKLDKFQGSSAMTASEINAGGTVLGGLGDAANRYAQFQLQAGNSLNSGTNSGGYGGGGIDGYDNY